jgi:hypothetical protein
MYAPSHGATNKQNHSHEHKLGGSSIIKHACVHMESSVFDPG